MLMIKLLASVLVLSAVFAEYRDYSNYRLLRVSPRGQMQINLVGDWQHNPDFDVWSVDTDHIDVLLSPAAFGLYTNIMSLNGVQYDILNDNIQRNIDEEQRTLQQQRMKAAVTGETKVVDTFARFNDINNWLDSLATANSFVSTYSIGTTNGGRNLKVIRINKPGTTKKVWIDCGIHAREWISPSTCVWMIDAWISNANGGDANSTKVTDVYDIHVLPVHNPDGYEYSYTSDRMWRKNRRVNSGSSCIGVDLNRNFGYQWMVAGASSNPCSDTYAGPTQDSEAETKAVEAAINAYKGQWAAFFTIHTYGQYWFTPWGYTSALPSDYSDLVAKSNIGTAAIKSVNNLVFSVGSSTNLLYAAAGGSDDWAKAVAGVKYSHCLELRPGSSGTDASFGFQLPVTRVPLAGKETWVGITAFLNGL